MAVDFAPVLIAILNAVAPNLLWVVASIALGYLTPLAAKYLGQKNAQALQVRVDELLHRGISSAVAQTSGLIGKGNYSVQVQGTLAGLAAQYVVNHAPELAKQVGNTAGSLEDKALARLASHPDVQAAVAGEAPPEPAGLPLGAH